jgi:hypothetical protein
MKYTIKENALTLIYFLFVAAIIAAAVLLG